VSHVDWAKNEFAKWCRHHQTVQSTRIQEAVALASKTAGSTATVAELCWSDDPGYVAGYIAAQSIGYIRLSPLKKKGSLSGGRVFFVQDDVDLTEYIHFLSKVPSIIQMEVK